MPPAFEVDARIPAGPVTLEGRLARPPHASGVIVFVHGSGSSRFSPRNKLVARALHNAGFATLLMDLLTPDEAVDRANVFDVRLLAARVRSAVKWLDRHADKRGLGVGLFGASTGAAAALVAAGEDPDGIRAIVSRGGRPDLAGEFLPKVTAPTLLIVGGADVEVLQLNRAALAQMNCPKALEIVPGATHLFEESGALEEVVALARSWFQLYLERAPAPTAR